MPHNVTAFATSQQAPLAIHNAHRHALQLPEQAFAVFRICLNSKRLPHDAQPGCRIDGRQVMGRQSGRFLHLQVGQLDERNDLIDMQQDIFCSLCVIDAGIADAHQQIGQKHGLGAIPDIHRALLCRQEHRLVITAPHRLAGMKGFLQMQGAQVNLVPHQRTRHTRKLLLVFRPRASCIGGPHGCGRIVKRLAQGVRVDPLGNLGIRQASGLLVQNHVCARNGSRNMGRTTCQSDCCACHAHEDIDQTPHAPLSFILKDGAF